MNVKFYFGGLKHENKHKQKSIRHKVQDSHAVNAASSFSIHKYENFLDLSNKV